MTCLLRSLRTGRGMVLVDKLPASYILPPRAMSGKHCTGTLLGTPPATLPTNRPGCHGHCGAMLLHRQLPDAAHPFLLFRALKGDVSHSPYLSSQLPSHLPAFLQAEGSGPSPAICSSSDKSQCKAQHTNKHRMSSKSALRESVAGQEGA